MAQILANSIGEKATIALNYFVEQHGGNIINFSSEHNPLMDYFVKNKRYDQQDAGYRYQPSFQSREGVNPVKPYTGAQILDISQDSLLSRQSYALRDFYAPLSITLNEILDNGDASTSEQLINLLTARSRQLFTDWANFFETASYGTGEDRELEGLGHLLPLDNSSGTYGGIDRELYPRTRHAKWTRGDEGGNAAMTPTILINALLKLTRATTFNNETPDLFIMGENVMDYFEQYFTDKTSFQHTPMASNGRMYTFEKANPTMSSYQFRDATILYAKPRFGDTGLTTFSGINPNTVYVLNTKSIYPVFHSKAKLKMTPMMQPYNQLAFSSLSYSRLNWAMLDGRKNAVLSIA